MRPCHLSLDGFRAYAGRCELDLSQASLLAVTGTNGAGKSTLFDAMLWALYGETAEHTLTSLINDEAKAATVKFTFEGTDGRSHTFTRNAKATGAQRATSSAEYANSDGEAVSGSREVTAQAERLLGCDQDLLGLTCFARQGQIGRFAAMPPRDRRDLLVQLTVGALFEPLGERSQLERGSSDRRAAAATAALDSTREEAATLPERTAELAEAEEEAAAAHEHAQDLAARTDPALEHKLNTARQAARQLAAAQDRRGEAQAARQRASRRAAEAAHALEEAAPAAEQAAEQAARLRGEAERAKADAETAAARDESLRRGDSGACWTCGQPLGAEARRRLLDGLAEAQNTHRRCAQQAQQAQQAHRQARQEVDAAQQQRGSAERQAASAQAALTESERAIETLTEDAAGLADLEATAEFLSPPSAADVEAAQRQVRQHDKQVGYLQAQVAAAEQAGEHLPELEADEAEARRDAAAWGLIHASTRAQGMPSVLLADRIKECEQRINRILAKLGNLQIRFALASSTGRPALDIEARNAHEAWRAYQVMSGGLRMRIDIAIRLGLMSLFGVRCETLVLDEGTSALDATGVSALVATLSEITNAGLLDSIFVISHDPALAARFPARIEVARVESGAQARVIA